MKHFLPKQNSIFLLILLLWCLSAVLSYAQDQGDRKKIIAQSNTSALKRIAKNANEKYLIDLNRAQKIGMAMQLTNRQGEKFHFHSFDSMGRPIYAIDDNLQIAKASNVENLWRGGESGYDLSGAGIEVGLWETGQPLSAHQDLLGKITLADNEMVSSHATHTAGTIAGSGINPEAIGMAKNAKIFSRTSRNDESEMAIFAMNGGLISNHSYRFSVPEENAEFYGVYNDFSAKWDAIAYNAPYYTICKSGGNGRNDGFNEKDMGFDLMYNNSCSKNILVISATRKIEEYNGPLSVIPASFSNYGPTDDWRIKPDITTNGVDIISCDSGNTLDYGSKSGTSMSTAAVSGIIALLQEHYHNLTGDYMRASTVRALLIASAKEAGSTPGPDFKSGWGLLDAGYAAEIVAETGNTFLIEELSINENDSILIPLEFSGKQNARITIAWTDPPGAANFSGEDSQSLSLVNDLDIRLEGEGAVYLPWIMTPNEARDNFADPAGKGDNYRDNCERIDLDNIIEGVYTLHISHKNQLEKGKQDFSLVISGLRNTSSVNEADFQGFDMKLYPNPVNNGILNMNFREGYIDSQAELSIYNTSGQRISFQKISGSSSTIDVSNFANGIYLVALQNEGKVLRKFISIINN